MVFEEREVDTSTLGQEKARRYGEHIPVRCLYMAKLKVVIDSNRGSSNVANRMFSFGRAFAGVRNGGSAAKDDGERDQHLIVHTA